MKIYVVVGDNCELWEDDVRWIDAVFTSKESAEKYIHEQPAKFAEDKARFDRLDRIDDRTLTEDEVKEVDEFFKRYRSFYNEECPSYTIEEYELRD